MPVETFACCMTRCPREIGGGLFCAEHQYLNSSPVALWAVRALDERTRERRGLWCNGETWGFR